MFKRNLKIGFIKGGQLGKMLLQVAPSFDIHSYVLDDDPNCPCRHLCHEFVLGKCESFEDVYQFGKKVELLTLEYEHVNIQALKQLKSEGLTIFPDPDILEIIQDKGRQKEFYRQHQIPTAPFILIEGRAELEHVSLQFPLVQKTRTAGYDGKGIYKLTSKATTATAFDQPSVLEEYVDFDKEIAVLVARNQKGQTVVYPAVEMIFHPTKHLVEYLSCPARITEGIAKQAHDIAIKLADVLNLTGILAVEMFVTRDGQVLVNEIAPRVHNSGHHTIEANETSQFEQHLRAIMNLPLGSPQLIKPAVMVNILGDEGYTGKARYEGVDEALALGGVSIHLYGKEITKPFRKMGHASIIDDDLQKAQEKAKSVRNLIKVKV